MSKSKLIKLPTLEDCQTGLAEEWKAINFHARKAKYRSICVGLWLLKAQEIHRCPTVGQRRDEGRFGTAEAETTFDAWLQTTGTDLGFSRASGYNWMNAALNAGLTTASTLADVDELEERDALAERKLSAHDLYAPPRLTEGSAEEADAKAKRQKQQRPEVKAQQEWFPFYEQLAFYGTDEKETDLLYHLPLTTVDPTKEVSLNDLENNLENALARVREIKKERLTKLKGVA